MRTDIEVTAPTVVLVTPNDADSAVATRFLAGDGLAVRPCRALSQLHEIPPGEIGCIVAVEEALVEPELHAFHDALDRQPAWSDIPLVLVASAGTPLHAFADFAFPRAGNVTLLQRPLHPVSLVSAVRVALRARARQLEVRDLIEQQRRAVRQRDEFLAMLAHELRNPLAPIRNAVYLLGRMQSPDPAFEKCRAMIDKQTRHIVRLVDDLLDVSRLELGKVELRLETIDLNRGVEAAAEACAAATGTRRQAVRLGLPPAPVMVHADAVRLEQAVGNLMLNASKFTPPGGEITVTVSTAGGQAVVAVADNGVGIRPEMIDTIFDLFAQDSVTLARTEGGLGIGLTLVKHLVELHGGTVQARSAGPGRGSCFEIRLPLAVGEEIRVEPREAPPPRAGVRKRVLVVEDGDDTRDSLGMLVTDWNYDVLYATTGPEGAQRAHATRPDVVLVDIGLPGFDGYEVARRIRGEGSEWSRRVRLIALTGYGQEADRALAREAGFDVHLLKPVDPVTLRGALAQERAEA